MIFCLHDEPIPAAASILSQNPMYRLVANGFVKPLEQNLFLFIGLCMISLADVP